MSDDAAKALPISAPHCLSQSASSRPATALSLERVSTEEGFDELEAPWLKLENASASAGMFNSWHWNRLWWKHYARQGELMILVVRIDDVIQGIAPFYLSQVRTLRYRMVKTLRFLGVGGDTSPDDLDILCNEHHQEVVSQEICSYLLEQRDIERFWLTDVPVASIFLDTLLKRSKSNGWPHAQLLSQKRRVDTLPNSIDVYVQGLSRNSRKQRKRRLQALQQAGTAQFMICKTPEQVRQNFQKLVELHCKRQTSKGESGSFTSEQYNDFHLSLMLQALQRGELRLVTLTLDGQIIGIEYAFLVKGVLSFFQTGFDPAFAHLSPGHLLMRFLIDQAIDEGARQIDLLKGEYEYKASYAKQWKLSQSLSLWRSQIMGNTLRLVHTLRSQNSL